MKIPQGWEVTKLKNIANIKRGRFSIRPRNDPRYYGGEIPFVQTGDISKSNKYIKTYQQTLNDDGLKVSKVFPRDTILLTIAANIGDVAITKFGVACPDSLVGLTSEGFVDTEWLYYYLFSGRKVLSNLAPQNAQKNLNVEILGLFKIMCPPITEQKKIAEILSCWDEAIEKIEKLITAKKTFKKGVMQKLLSGKVRFKRFNGRWKKYKFKDLFNSKKVEAGKEELEILSVTKNGVVPQLEYFNKQIASSDTEKYLKVEKWDFVMSGLNFWMGSIDVVYDFEKGKISPAYKVFTNTNQLSKEYMRFFVRSEIMKKSLIGCSVQGASIVRRNLDKDMLENFKYLLPLIDEQKQISDILSVIDREIRLFEKERNALKKQKKGLMQKLLTGKVRVKV
jgi:type I restriction enzyme S subunit